MNSDRFDIESILKLEGSELQWPIQGAVEIDDNDATGEYFIDLGDSGHLVLADGLKDYGNNEDGEFQEDTAENVLDLSDAWGDLNIEFPPPFLKEIEKDSVYTISLEELRRLAQEQDVELGLALAGHKRPARPAESLVEKLLGD